METIYYPDEIAETLCKLAFDFPDEKTIKECTEALHDLRAIAENPYNNRCDELAVAESQKFKK